jgi:hypothetical protein
MPADPFGCCARNHRASSQPVHVALPPCWSRTIGTSCRIFRL